MEANRSLYIRANRGLGTALVREGLITHEKHDAAAQRLLELTQADNLRGTGLLSILVNEHRSLSEEALLDHLATQHGAPLVDLRCCNVLPTPQLDPGACWATWTMPYDEREGVHFVATCYYLSEQSRTWWEKRLGGEVIWYVTGLSAMAAAIERYSAHQAMA